MSMDNSRVFCNQCGKELKKEGNILLEDALFVGKAWGYFSNKDLEKHSFVLCERCYDIFSRGFVIPVKKERVTEL